ncbi:MAG: isoprenylcysteine carboxylmethyltransferase family protein [Planctomycetota bacterium]|nr:isoprenylcysteine carboxylmethyltransferase family protein [Planctomycetota bacterium]
MSLASEDVIRWMPAASVATVVLLAAVNVQRIKRKLGYSPFLVFRSGTPREKLRTGFAIPGGAVIVATSFEPSLIGPVLPTSADPLLQAFGFALWIGAVVIVLASFRGLGDSWRIGVDPRTPPKLVTHGIYAFVRHPIYAGFLWWFVGLLLLLPSVFFLVVAVVGYVLVLATALREERFLLELYPEEYAVYARHVGRFFPRLLRRS